MTTVPPLALFKSLKVYNQAVLILLYLTLSYFFCLFSYWDMAYDSDVMENRVGLNLLYAQVRGFIT